MKNKRWKRKAKKLFGYCISRKCIDCKFYNEDDCCSESYIPAQTNIRDLEKEFKNVNNKREKWINNYKNIF